MKKKITVIMSVLCCANLFLAGCGSSNSTVTDNAYDNNAVAERNVGDTIILGTFEQDNNESNGREPVEWIILSKRDDGAMLVISKYGLQAVFDNNAYDFDRNDGGTGKRVSWDTSLFRNSLNLSWLDYMFSKEEQKRILEHSTVPEQNPKFDENQGAEVPDRLFLLSPSEVDKYFGTSSETFTGSIGCRRCVPTTFAKDYTYAYVEEGDTAGCWYLRTTGDCYSSTHIVYVDENGEIDYAGWSTDCGGCMIRPAMWIKSDM